ncbi:MAG TPA: ABC transporter substrate-binding protein [Stellaceae bacterium]|nr:ABC transporter substrate-binding protein [Stellaceae bacterium]
MSDTAKLIVAMAGLVLAAPPARAAALPTVTLANPSVSLSFAVSYLAQDLGLFRKNGLDVKLVEINGVGALNAVISGSAEFSQSSGPSFTRAAAKGQRLLAIAELADRPSSVVILRKSLAEQAGFDPAAPLSVRARLLEGRTIAVDAVNSINHAYVRVLAARGGFDPEAIKLAIMPSPSAAAAFETKAIDGFASGPPWPEKPVLAGEAVVVASGPNGDPPDALPFASLVLVTRPETCAKTPDYCIAMGKSFAEASSFLHTHREESLALLGKRLPGFDPTLLASLYGEMLKYAPDPPVPTLKALENDEIFSVDAGLLAPDDRLKDYDGLFTDRYVR